MTSAQIRYQHTLQVLSRKVAGDRVLISTENEEIRRLSNIAAVIWILLDEPMTLSDLTANLTEISGISPEDMAPRVTELIGQLVDHRLVEEVVAGREGGQ